MADHFSSERIASHDLPQNPTTGIADDERTAKALEGFAGIDEAHGVEGVGLNGQTGPFGPQLASPARHHTAGRNVCTARTTNRARHRCGLAHGSSGIAGWDGSWCGRRVDAEPCVAESLAATVVTGGLVAPVLRAAGVVHVAELHPATVIAALHVVRGTARAAPSVAKAEAIGWWVSHGAVGGSIRCHALGVLAPVFHSNRHWVV